VAEGPLQRDPLQAGADAVHASRVIHPKQALTLSTRRA